MTALRRFFKWLAAQEGYKRSLNFDDAEYFSLSEKETRIATARRDRQGPTIDQIEQVLAMMPCDTEIERRDRTLIAFLILVGARDGAIASLKLKHVDLEKGEVFQDAREVETKASKTITTWFFPVGGTARQIVVDWVEYLLKTKLWGPEDPLFPATRVAQNGNHQFAAVGVERANWSGATAIRKIVKSAFVRAGIDGVYPHSFRKTLGRLGEQLCRTPEEFKAWSQNLGHENVMTTFTSYGAVSAHRQAEIIGELGSRDGQGAPDEEAIRRLLAAADALRKR